MSLNTGGADGVNHANSLHICQYQTRISDIPEKTYSYEKQLRSLNIIYL
jgi:hypothetical protein